MNALISRILGQIWQNLKCDSKQTKYTLNFLKGYKRAEGREGAIPLPEHKQNVTSERINQ